MIMQEIQLNENQILFIYDEYFEIKRFSKNREFYLSVDMFNYKNILERLEVRKAVNYVKVFFYDEDGNEFPLEGEFNNMEIITISITPNFDVMVDKLEKALKVVKILNKIIEEANKV